MKASIFYFRRLLFLLLINIAFVIPAFSQAGSNDPTFNSTDQGFGFGDGANGSVLTTAIQSDGKIIIAGGFTTYNGTVRNNIARLNTDGSLDAGFNPGTGTGGTIQTAAIQSDGKIIIGGTFFSFNGTARNNIARLNADGSLDAGFNPGTGTTSTIYSSSIQSDGKIIIGGIFNAYNGTTRNAFARLNADGSLDAAFNAGTGVGAGAIVYTIPIQNDGKIIIGGQFTFYNGTARRGIA
ncbi:MAG: delta-60 repeat domain-containing protein, partial [Ferruginibacter sp.]